MLRGFYGFGSYISGSIDEELEGKAYRLNYIAKQLLLNLREFVQNADCQISSTSHDLLEIPVHHVLRADHVPELHLN